MQEKFQGLDAVDGLHPHDVLKHAFGLGAIEQPFVGSDIGVRNFVSEPVDAFGADLQAVGVAHHVVVEHDDPHTSHLHAAGLEGAMGGRFESFGTGAQLAFHFRIGGVVKATVGPMPVRT